jgi:hypothetical protein
MMLRPRNFVRMERLMPEQLESLARQTYLGITAAALNKERARAYGASERSRPTIWKPWEEI